MQARLSTPRLTVLGLAARDRSAVRSAARRQVETYPWTASVAAMLRLHGTLTERAAR